MATLAPIAAKLRSRAPSRVSVAVTGAVRLPRGRGIFVDAAQNRPSDSGIGIAGVTAALTIAAERVPGTARGSLGRTSCGAGSRRVAARPRDEPTAGFAGNPDRRSYPDAVVPLELTRLVDAPKAALRVAPYDQLMHPTRTTCGVSALESYGAKAAARRNRAFGFRRTYCRAPTSTRSAVSVGPGDRTRAAAAGEPRHGSRHRDHEGRSEGLVLHANRP